MSNKVFNVLLLLSVVVFGFIYQDKLYSIWKQALNNYFPCEFSISYSIGEFDSRFGITREDFLSSLKKAEAIWEDGASGVQLFNYVQDDRSDLKVNLVYDERQAVTEQLKNMGLVVSNTRSSYDSLKAKYELLQSEYRQERAVYSARVSDFESRKFAYETEVKSVNSRGGANKTNYNRLSSEKEYLNSEISNLNSMQKSLNQKVDSINALASTLNDLAKNLNMTVDKFNNIGDSLGGEFEEGTYISDERGRRINIYQFENRTKLVRVLTHEFGHAIGLDHNEDSKAIMYRLNNGINEKPTNTDLMDLKKLCKIE